MYLYMLYTCIYCKTASFLAFRTVLKGQNLLYVAVHELGHALGLRHSDVEDSIMYPYARGYDPNLKLFPDDIAGIQSLYGEYMSVAIS